MAKQDIMKVLEATPLIKALSQLSLGTVGGAATGLGIGAVKDVPEGKTLVQHLRDSAAHGAYIGAGGAVGALTGKGIASKIRDRIPKPGLLGAGKDLAINIGKKDILPLLGTSAGAAAGFSMGDKRIKAKQEYREYKEFKRRKDKDLSELQVEEGSDMANKEAKALLRRMLTNKEAAVGTHLTSIPTGRMLGGLAGYRLTKEAARFDSDSPLGNYLSMGTFGGVLGGLGESVEGLAAGDTQLRDIGRSALTGAGTGLGFQAAKDLYGKPETIMGKAIVPGLGALLAYNILRKRKKQQSQPNMELANV